MSNRLALFSPYHSMDPLGIFVVFKCREILFVASSDPSEMPDETKKSFRVVLKYGMYQCKSKAGKDGYCKCIEKEVSEIFVDIARKYCDPKKDNSSISAKNVGTWAFWFPIFMKAGKVDVDKTAVNSKATTNCENRDWNWVNVNDGLFILCGLPRKN